MRRPMEHRRRGIILCALYAVAALALLGCVMLTLFQLPTLELNAARGRWAARSFSHYRLELKYGEFGYCRQSIEVRDERVVAVLVNTCAEPAPTVSELFQQIERDLRTVQG